MTKRHCFVTDVGIAIEKLADSLDPERSKPFGGDILDLLEWATKDVLELHQQLAAKQAEVDALMLEYCPSEIRVDELKVTMTVEQTPRHLFKDLANKPETRWVPCKESGIQKMQHNVDGMWKDIPPFWID